MLFGIELVYLEDLAGLSTLRVNPFAGSIHSMILEPRGMMAIRLQHVWKIQRNIRSQEIPLVQLDIRIIDILNNTLGHEDR